MLLAVCTHKLSTDSLSVIATLISVQVGLSRAYSFGLSAPEQSAIFYNFLFLCKPLKQTQTEFKQIQCSLMGRCGMYLFSRE